MHSGRLNHEWEEKNILKFLWCYDIQNWRRAPFPEFGHMINLNSTHPTKAITFFPLEALVYCLFTLLPKNREPRRTPTVALVVIWQNKVGDRPRRDGRRKQRMNNVRVMPRDLSTSFVLPLIWIPQQVTGVTGSLSSCARRPLTVTGFSGGHIGARGWVCVCARRGFRTLVKKATEEIWRGVERVTTWFSGTL